MCWSVFGSKGWTIHCSIKQLFSNKYKFNVRAGEFIVFKFYVFVPSTKVLRDFDQLGVLIFFLYAESSDFKKWSYNQNNYIIKFLNILRSRKI